jgi:hypothetical protein
MHPVRQVGAWLACMTGDAGWRAARGRWMRAASRAARVWDAARRAGADAAPEASRALADSAGGANRRVRAVLGMRERLNFGAAALPHPQGRKGARPSSDDRGRPSWIVTLKAAASVLHSNKNDGTLLENFPATAANHVVSWCLIDAHRFLRSLDFINFTDARGSPEHRRAGASMKVNHQHFRCVRALVSRS